MFECTNCEGSGFDTIDGGEVACSVCHGSPEIDAGALDAAIAERDALRVKLYAANQLNRALEGFYDDLFRERDALRSEVATYRKTLDEVSEIGTKAVDENDALRTALQSLVDGKSEFDIEYDTGMPADEARRIMDLTYNRK